MAWFTPIYDRIMANTEAGGLGQWRSELLAEAHGDVLELGAGTGASLPHYPAAVDRLVLTEPDAGMRAKLSEKVVRPAEIVDARAEALPFADESFDAVVAMLVLCTVPDPVAAVAEVRRVLRPGGALIFVEHVAAAPGSSRRAWQHRLEPVWKRLAGGCCITRDTEAGTTISLS